MRIALDSLVSVDYNPRKITPNELKNLAASIETHTAALEGWSDGDGYRLASSITINRQGLRIIGGNQRVEALRVLGQDWIHEDDVTWVDVAPNSPEEKSLNISLNQNAGNWDDEKLETLLSNIKEESEALFDALDFPAVFKTLSGESIESAENRKKTSSLVRDHLSFIVDEIMDRYGNTLPNGFIFFVYKEKMNLLVLCDDELNDLICMMSSGLRRENFPMNDFLKRALKTGFMSDEWEHLKIAASLLDAENTKTENDEDGTSD